MCVIQIFINMKYIKSNETTIRSDKCVTLKYSFGILSINVIYIWILYLYDDHELSARYSMN